TTATQAMRLPKSNKMTARQVDDIPYTRRIAKTPEKRLSQQENNSIQAAYQEISKRENSLTETIIIKETNTAHDARKDIRGILQAFESSSGRQKELHTQHLRTTRAWAKLCAKERPYVRQRALEEHKSRSVKPGPVV
ncbi:hypothetical protein BGZ54_002000, partial [Gamsiella multidivaricata]